jgi:lysophospholipase L1-like esterase
VTRRFLALGDSYTIGEGVTAEEGWPVQLAASVRASGIRLADPQIIARTGWTTSELFTGIEGASPRPSNDFALVTLQIGVNDQYRSLGIDAFRRGFGALLEAAVAFAAGDARRVIVASIPDWSVTPFGESDPRGKAAIALEIDALNAIAGVATRHAGACFIDVTSNSRRGSDDRTLIAADGLHPSAAMYASWVRLMLPAALSALRTS